MDRPPPPLEQPLQLSATPLHQNDANEEDESVKQLQECSSLYLSLQALDMIKKSTPKKKDKEKKPSLISADDAKKMEKEVEELTKKYIKSAEDMCKAKEKEITES